MSEKSFFWKENTAHNSVLRQQLHLSLHTGSAWSTVQTKEINPGIQRPLELEKVSDCKDWKRKKK